MLVAGSNVALVSEGGAMLIVGCGAAGPTCRTSEDPVHANRSMTKYTTIRPQLARVAQCIAALPVKIRLLSRAATGTLVETHRVTGPAPHQHIGEQKKDVDQCLMKWLGPRWACTAQEVAPRSSRASFPAAAECGSPQHIVLTDERVAPSW